MKKSPELSRTKAKKSRRDLLVEESINVSRDQFLESARAPDKGTYLRICPPYLSIKTYAVGAQTNRLVETVRVRPNNICFSVE